MRKYIILALLMTLQMMARGQTAATFESLGLPRPTTAKSMRYWIDDDAESVKAIEDMSGKYTIDMSALIEGLHTIHYQIIDSEGKAAVPYSGIFLILPKGAYTQASKLRYWFDDATEVKTCNANVGIQALDASSLLDGVHTMHYQIVDTEGEASYIASNIFLKLNAGAYAKANRLRYWFDDEDDVMTCNVDAGIQALDVSSLIDGVHTLHYQIVDTEGDASYIASNIFLKIKGAGTDEKITAKKIVYWFDDQETTTTVEMTSGIQVLDASNLLNGLHTIHYMVVCSDGSITSAYSSIFMRMDIDAETTAAKSMRYWFDDETDATQVEITAGVQTLDASNLLDGLHTVHYQLIDNKGVSAIPMSNLFLKMTGDTSESSAAQSLRYWFDDDTDVKVTNVASGTQSLDVTGLITGLHTLHYQLIDNKGNVCSPMSGIFMKMYDKTVASGENVITQYMYWMNDDSKDNKKVTIGNPTSPYQLITLLPMIKAPIRSYSFHFEVKEGEPMIYAKNDLHIRFEDAAGYWADASKSFIDYSVSEKAEITKQLTETIGKETFSSPKDGEIKWYAMECEKGDSIAVKLSQPSSVQVFSPSGKELLNVSGSESVNMSGVRIPKNDTYYIAIHDVTGSASEMCIDYMKIGKFALITNSSSSLGVLPIVQIINIEGNGFDNLKTASITKDGNILKADSIAHVSNQTARLYWLLSGNEPLGNYDLTLHFDDEDEQRDIIKKEFVTLEKPSFDDITIEVSDPRRVADPYPVYIKVTNNSNIAYQAIPFYFAIDHIDRMQSVKYMDFAVGCCKELYDAGLKLSFEYDSFNGNNSKTRVVPTIIPEILPGETKTFTLGVKTGAHQIFNVYAWHGRPWNLLAPETMDYIKSNYSELMSARNVKKAPGVAGIFDGCEDDPCDLAGVGGDLAECACGMALALGGTLGGIQNALQNQHNRAMRDQLAQSGLFDDPNEFFPDQHLPSPADLSWYWMQHCLPGKAGQAASAYDTGRELMGDNPCQDPPPHECNAYNPGDPNEMHGYVSESGSKHIRQEVLDVSYTIEFENDPELANASAHKIIVCDTLDTTIFDMATFKPTSVKIGNKSIELDGSQNTIQTIDMRPEIYAIAQVETEFNQQTGIAKWTISSLDPMSMEDTYDIMQGVLPVNNGGNGVGFLTYSISLKQKLDDGDSFSNLASIKFDFENDILTPIWTNTVDAVCPESHVTDIVQKNDTIASVYFEGEDNRSGIWKYDVYIQYGQGSSWVKYAECGADSSYVDFRYYDGLDYGFCVLATDSAGNVEQKELTREIGFSTVVVGDPNSDGYIDIGDYTTIANYILGTISNTFVEKAADVNGDTFIDVGDLTAEANLILYGGNAVQAKPRYATEDEALIFINDTTMTAGEEVVLSVKMKNDVPMTGFQFDVVMPEGLSIAMDEDGYYLIDLSTERTTTRNTNTFDSALQTDGSVRVLAGSTKSKTFEGTDGEVCTITVKAAEGIADGTYTVVLKNIVMSDATGKTYKVDRSEAIITIGTTTGINAVGTKSANGKYLKDNKVTIIRNGKKYTAVGMEE